MNKGWLTFWKRWNQSETKKETRFRLRRLGLESLEQRQLLSVTPTTAEGYAEICAAYSDLNLPAYSETVVQDLDANDLTVETLQNAIYKAQTDAKPDVIIIHTAEENGTGSNTIQFREGSASLNAGISVEDYGSLSIIAWGDAPLTLDANKLNCGLIVYAVKLAASDQPAEAMQASQPALSSRLNLGGIRIINGYENSGAGIYSVSSDLSLSNCELSDNKTTNSNQTTQPVSLDEFCCGGGISVFGGSLTVNNSKISDNCSDMGGGIYAQNAIVRLDSCLIKGNKANSAPNGCGGGIMSFYSNTLESNEFSLEMVNCAVVENSTGSDGVGGGVLNMAGAARLASVTISGNTAPLGADLCNYSGTVDIYNSILLNCVLNPDTKTNAQWGETAYNLSSYEFSGTENAVYDPKLPLFAEGGYELAANSQAFNQGNVAYLTDGAGRTISKDLARNDRVRFSTVDLGAYEFQASTESLSGTGVLVSEANKTPVDAPVADRAPEPLTVLNEWSRFGLEYWVSTSDVNADSIYEISFECDPTLFELAGVEVGTGAMDFADAAGYFREDGTFQVTVWISFTELFLDSVKTAPGAMSFRVDFQPVNQKGGVATVDICRNDPEKPWLVLNDQNLSVPVWANLYDLDDSGSVSMTDFIAFATNFNKSVAGSGPITNACDFNGDGAVTMSDFILFATNFNKKCASGTEIEIVRSTRAENASPAAPAAAVPASPAAVEQAVDKAFAEFADNEPEVVEEHANAAPPLELRELNLVEWYWKKKRK